jgi:RNA polymerase sigma-70 factor (ECF subfamily)
VTAYALRAAIAALHAQAPTAAATDWPQIVLLCRELMKRLPSGVVALNHAAAVAMAEGARAGLQPSSELSELEELQSYQPFFATRADLLRRLGKLEQAVPDYERSLQLAKNEPEKRYLSRRLEEMRGRIGNQRDT